MRWAEHREVVPSCLRCEIAADEVTPATCSVETAAVLLGVSRSHAYDLVRRGEFPVPVIRLGRTVRVPRAALNNLLGVS